MFRSVCRLAAALVAGMAILAPPQAGAQPPYTVVPGTQPVEIPGFGALPREIIWTADGATMVLIPGGKYRIGLNDPRAKGYPSAEGPQVEVEVAPFYIDKTEVVYSQYSTLAERWGLTVPRGFAAQGLLDNESAVSGIAWADAKSYAERVGKDLPTEAEWEIAARGPEAWLFPWGNDSKPDALKGEQKPRKPGSNPLDVSPFGVLDMAGNVSEWTRDYYDRGYYEKVDRQTDPQIAGPEESRTVRGGNFYGRSDGRLTFRQAVVPVYTPEEIGFRTVFRLRQAPPEPEPTPTPTPTPAPTPSRADRLDDLRERLLPHFRDPEKELPQDVQSSKATGAAIPVLNQSPQNLLVALVDPATMEVLNFGTQVGRASLARIPARPGQAFELLAYAPEGSLGAVKHLGLVNADSGALLVIESHTFSRMRSGEDSVKEPAADQRARQIYQATMRPLWNQFEVYNGTSLPVRVVVSLAQGEQSHEAMIEPGEAHRFTQFGAADLKITAQYIGAAEEVTSNVVAFKNDDRSDLRVFHLREDENAREPVRVVTRRVPPIRIQAHQLRLPDDVRAKYVAK